MHMQNAECAIPFAVQLWCKLGGSFGNETVCFKDAESLACMYVWMDGWMDGWTNGWM